MESNERSASAAGPISEDPSNREPEELWDFDSLSDTASPSDTDSSDADSDSSAGDSVQHEEGRLQAKGVAVPDTLLRRLKVLMSFASRFSYPCRDHHCM